MSKWYDDWKAKENDMPVNFGRYIGNEKGKDPGATNAQMVLNQAHRNLKSTLGSSKHNPEELQQLSNFLTAIFFGGDLGDNSSVTTRFLNTVIKAYSEVYNEEIQMAEGFGGDITKSTSFSTRQVLDKTKVIEQNRKNTQNRCLNTIHKEIVEIETILRSIDIRQLKDATVKRKMQKIYDNYDTIVMLYGYQAGVSAELPNASDFDSLWSNVKSKMLIKDGIIEDLISLDKIQGGDGLKNTRTNLIKTLNEFETYCVTLKKLALVTPATYGNVFEFGLALVNKYTEVMAMKAEDWSTKKLKQIGKEFVTGGKTVSRGGGEHPIAVDVNKIFDDELTKYDSTNSFYKNMAVFKDGVTEIDNIKFSTDGLDGSLRTDEEKYAKVDVFLTAPDAAGDIVKGKQFKVSAKNWNTIDSSHNLGETTFLRGIDRTVRMVSDKEETLLNYIYVMQHPISGEQIPNRDFLSEPEERRPIATSALKEGHQLAKESLILDIAMGLSQKQYSADTLIIMDRQRKRVVVMDLIDEINKYMNSSKSALYLDGYDENEIESTARAFRSTIRKNVSYVGRDRNYISLMKLYLNSKKATVKLTSNFIKSL